MKVTGSVIGGEKVAAKLARITPAIVSEVSKQVQRSTFEVEAHIKQNKLSGQVLNRRTGNLSRSIHSEFQGLGTPNAIGTVGTNAVYARIHERGGMIEAKNAALLKFQIGGQWISKRAVRMPERSFARSALTEKAPKILTDMAAAVKRGINAA